MIPASTTSQPVGARTAAIRATVAGLTALQSAYTGLRAAAASAGTRRSARPMASPGGTMDRMMSDAAIAAASTARIPAWAARAAEAAERPASQVRTSTPCARSRAATALPMAPGAITATIGGMAVLLALRGALGG